MVFKHISIPFRHIFAFARMAKRIKQCSNRSFFAEILGQQDGKAL